jgi:hypothetical protein
VLVTFIFFHSNGSFVLVCPGTAHLVCDVAALFFVCVLNFKSALVGTLYLSTLWTYNKLTFLAYACANPSL